MESVVASSTKVQTTIAEYPAAKKRIEYIDALRGFSMFCVVLMHFWNRFPMDIQHNIYFAGTESFIQMFFLSLFFLISGFFSCRPIAGKQIIDRFITYVLVALFFALLYEMMFGGG